jgi:hypothetical protein
VLLLTGRKAQDRKESSNVFYDYIVSTNQDSDIMEHDKKKNKIVFQLKQKPLVY